MQKYCPPQQAFRSIDGWQSRHPTGVVGWGWPGVGVNQLPTWFAKDIDPGGDGRGNMHEEDYIEPRALVEVDK